MTDQVIDRRAAIEAAFTQAEESHEPNEVVAPVSPEPVGKVEAEAGGQEETPEGEADKGNGEKQQEVPIAESVAPESSFPVEKAPQSWKPAQKAKWATLDPEVRQEVIRREREITRTLGETSQARQLSQRFNETVQPFLPRLQALGAEPLTAVRELLRSDYILSTGHPVQKAELIAKLIKDYGVNVHELDNVLAGRAPTDPVDSRVEELVSQRLAPFQQFIQNQHQREQAAQANANQENLKAIAAMENDPKYTFFDDVRSDMGDIIDLQAKKGVYLSLDQAYNLAVAMNPELSAQVSAQKEAESKRLSALAATAKAQKALNASSSVAGAPSGAVAGASSGKDRRSQIEAAYEAAGGR